MKKPMLIAVDDFIAIENALSLLERKPSRWQRLMDYLFKDETNFYF